MRYEQEITKTLKVIEEASKKENLASVVFISEELTKIFDKITDKSYRQGANMNDITKNLN